MTCEAIAIRLLSQQKPTKQPLNHQRQSHLKIRYFSETEIVSSKHLLFEAKNTNYFQASIAVS